MGFAGHYSKWIAGSVLAAVFLGASLLPKLPIDSIFQWKLLIVLLEYGHWFALIGLVAAFLALRLRLHAVGLLFCVASSFFSIPAIQMMKLAPIIDEKFTHAFGSAAQETEVTPTLMHLWGGVSVSRHKFETYVYNKNGKNPPKVELSLDLYRADASAGQRSPWILSIPGGAWTSSDRALLWEINSHLAERGYSVVVISYRVLPDYRWPSPRQDALEAVKYVKAHATEFGLDPERWVVMGHSAGGQIGESLAYHQPPAGLMGGIFFYAPADLNLAYAYAREDDLLKTGPLLRAFAGGPPGQAQAVFNEASPIRFVSKQSVPTLLLHGRRDPLVWYRQSENLAQTLTKNGVANVYVDLPWATHGFDYNFSGPGGLLGTYSVDRFLESVLPK